MSKIIPFSENDGYQEDPRPLPLYIAEQYNFSLQHYDTEHGVLYAIQDWIAGIGSANSKESAKMWSWMQQNQLSSSKSQLRITPMDYLATNGKTYQMDFTNDEGLYRIAQEMRVTKSRPALKSIKDFLAKAGVLVDEARRDPETYEAKLSAQRKKKWLRSGKEENWIAHRDIGVVTRKELMAIISQLLGKESEGIFRSLTDDTYIGVFGMRATEMRIHMGIPAGSNTREFMSTLGIIFVAQAEEMCRIALEGYRDDDIVKPKDVRSVIQMLSASVGENVKSTQDKLGIDVLTGKRLLPSGDEDSIA